MKLHALFCAALMAAHAALGWYLHQERPRLEIVPPPPGEIAARALGFGDAQFLYRSLALQLQNAGDTGGRFTPMSQYRWVDISPWLDALQSLDPRSHFYPFLTLRYFSLSWTSDDWRKVVFFIDRDVDLALDRKWFWQTQAVTIARRRLNDLDMALTLTRKLRDVASYLPEGYVWVMQMEPELLADLGRTDEARERMNIVDEQMRERMTQPEKNWTNNFYSRLN